MTLAEALFAKLYADVTAVADRIMPVDRDEETLLPALVYDLEEDYIERIGGNPTAARATLTLDAYGSTDDEATTTAATARTSLEGYSGVMGGAAGVSVIEIRALMKRLNAERIAPDEPVWVVTASYEILYYL